MAIASALVFTAPASADDPEVESVIIAGQPIVGMSLTATVEVDDGTPAGLEFAWRRCLPDQRSDCAAVPGATSASYLPLLGDLGQRLQARARALRANGKPASGWSDWSAPTAPVAAPVGTLSPVPPPLPQPQPFSPNVPPPAGPAPSAPTALVPRYLDPFPSVRIRGSIDRRGADVDLLRVSAPANATVRIRCSGSRCPVRRRTRGPGRIRRFERFLPAGMEITIRVRRQAFVGKYVRLKVRAGRAPARQDACVMPGSSRPVACPAQ